jgi:hypothetical protein
VASSIAAELSHAGIDALGRVGAGGRAYAGREHGSLSAVAFAVLVFGATTFLAAVLVKLRSANASGGRIRLSPPAVLLGSFGMLLGMEFVEQITAYGRIEGVGDALGGNASVGLAVVIVAALCVHRFGALLASPIVRSAARAAGVLALWISACERFAGKIVRGAVPPHRPRSTGIFLARSLGLRAPPIAPRFA